MPETKHTPEPWTDQTHPAVARVGGRDHPLRSADYARAMLCVNACRGLSAESLEAGLLDDLVDVAVIAQGILSFYRESAMNPSERELVASVYERLRGRVKKGKPT